MTVLINSTTLTSPFEITVRRDMVSLHPYKKEEQQCTHV
jgi:hypothetical protein